MAAKTKKKNSPHRQKLIKTFWFIANQIGVENARAVVFALYKTEHTTNLADYELENVIKTLKEKSNIEVGIPVKKKAASIQQSGGDLATANQLRKIEELLNQTGYGDEVLVALKYEFNRALKKNVNDPLTVRTAQMVIESLKDMKARKWQPDGENIWKGKVGAA
jgi:hypothetical protein